MSDEILALDKIYLGDCREVLTIIPNNSVDLVFADPPYNLQLEKELWRPNATKVNGVDDRWDQFTTFSAYDEFTYDWLQRCQKVLKDSGTIWVIGSYHNIFRVGRILQDLGFWILNDVVWIKNNPMPNFHGVRFTNAHETLIWAQKHKGKKYTFNYRAMKEINHGKNHDGNVQMRSDWKIPICTGKERIKTNGQKAHPTQKPEALLERVILSSTNPGDVILDPFFGTGTTGAVAKKFGRHWIGIEADEKYITLAQERIARTRYFEVPEYEQSQASSVRSSKRIPFKLLLQNGFMKESQVLYFGDSGDTTAIVLSNGQILFDQHSGSIHSIAREIMKAPSNGWLAWYYIDEATGKRLPIDQLRKMVRDQSRSSQT